MGRLTPSEYFCDVATFMIAGEFSLRIADCGFGIPTLSVVDDTTKGTTALSISMAGLLFWICGDWIFKVLTLATRVILSFFVRPFFLTNLLLLGRTLVNSDGFLTKASGGNAFKVFTFFAADGCLILKLFSSPPFFGVGLRFKGFTATLDPVCFKFFRIMKVGFMQLLFIYLLFGCDGSKLSVEDNFGNGLLDWCVNFVFVDCNLPFTLLLNTGTNFFCGTADAASEM